MFGRQAQIPVEIILGTASTSLETAYAYVRERIGHQME